MVTSSKALFTHYHHTAVNSYIDLESSVSQSQRDSTVQARDYKHQRAGSGALGASVCVLDPSSTPERSRGGERQVGGARDPESTGGMESERTEHTESSYGGELQAGVGSRSGDCTRSWYSTNTSRIAGNSVSGSPESVAASNGWMFFPDDSRLSPSDIFIKELGRWCEYYYERHGARSIINPGEVDSLGADPISPDSDPEDLSAPTTSYAISFLRTFLRFTCLTFDLVVI